MNVEPIWFASLEGDVSFLKEGTGNYVAHSFRFSKLLNIVYYRLTEVTSCFNEI